MHGSAARRHHHKRSGAHRKPDARSRCPSGSGNDRNQRRLHHERRSLPVCDRAARERGNGVRARSWVAEKIATGIATGLLTTKRYTPAHSGNLGIEISNEIGVEATRRNALGRPQQFPKPKVGGSSPLGTATLNFHPVLS